MTKPQSKIQQRLRAISKDEDEDGKKDTTKKLKQKGESFALISENDTSASKLNKSIEEQNVNEQQIKEE